MRREDLIEERLGKLVAGFGRYVEAYDKLTPISGKAFAAHQECLTLRHEAGSVRTAVGDERFIASLRQALIAWGMGPGPVKLVPEDEFAGALRAATPELEQLEPLTIDAADLPGDIADRLWLLIDSLGVVRNNAKIVAGTKTLHHLLPELVVPIDRRWTGTFFKLGTHEWQNPVYKRRAFQRVYPQLAEVARRVQPEQYVTGRGWRTCRTKVIDNAIIGFRRLEINRYASAGQDTVNDISFEVAGHPPAKNEALSILGAGHSHAPRVRLLLAAARRAAGEQAFVPIEAGAVALDVVVRTPADQPADATNYLGGIADVLEDKSRRGALDHLGELAGVWLYRNDRQIKQVSYRETRASQAGYRVTVRALDHRPAQQ